MNNNALGMLRTECQVFPVFNNVNTCTAEYKQAFMPLYSMTKKQLEAVDMPDEAKRYLRLYASNYKKRNHVVASRNWRKLLNTVADYSRGVHGKYSTHNILLFDVNGVLWIVPTAYNDVEVAYHNTEKYLVSQRWLRHVNDSIVELRSQHYYQRIYSGEVLLDFQYNHVVFDDNYTDSFHTVRIDSRTRMQSLIRSFVVMNGDYII